MAWNFGSFDLAGNVAAQVKYPRLYIRATFLIYPIIFLNYSLPIWIGTVAEPNTKAWHTGTLTESAFLVKAWAGYLLSAVGSLSSFFQYVSGLLALAKIIWVCSTRESPLHLFPSVLTRFGSHNSPVLPLIVGGLLCFVSTVLPFGLLIELNTAYRVVVLGLEFAALIKLQSVPTSGFKVPGGRLGAYLLPVPIAALSIFFLAQLRDWLVWTIFGGSTLLIVGWFLSWKMWRRGRNANLYSSLPQIS